MTDLQEILTNLNQIKTKLSHLKQDKTKFIKSSEVLAINDELTVQLRCLLAINKQHKEDQDRELKKKVDDTLDDIFQLMSLALLTVGLSRKAPATYASLCTVKQLLSHLSESSAFSESDVHPIQQRLEEITKIVDDVEQDSCEDLDSPESIEIIRAKLNHCKEMLEKVLNSMAKVSPELNPMVKRLVSLRREILAVGSKSSYSANAFKPMIDELRTIESKRDPVSGQFMSNGKEIVSDGTIAPEGQQVVNGLLEKCHFLIEDFTNTQQQQDLVDPMFKPMYSQLIEMKGTLENLLITHRWTLRPTDLYMYQKRLQEIDDLRSSHKQKQLKGQAVLLYLIRRCYAIIYKLLESSEPVSEALTPIHNQLRTVRKCLLEVKRMGGLSSERELYPYQMKLASIDGLRVDGKFLVGDSIPEGQGMVNTLLAECFDLCYELRVQIEENSNNDE